MDACRRITIAGTLFDTERHTLSRGDREIRLEPKLVALLSLLINRADDVLSREEIIDEVWDGAFGADQSLTRAVSQVRKALKESCEDDTPADQIIETIPKKGYRLRADYLSPVSASDLSPRRTPPASGPILAGAPRSGSFVKAIEGMASNVAAFRLKTPILLVGALLALVTALVAMRWGPDVAEKEHPVIAVLPLLDRGVQDGASPFADAVAEAILNHLAMSSELVVIGRSSSFRFRDDVQDLSAIRQALDVTHILEGSLTMEADEIVHIQARLVETDTGRAVWATTLKQPYTALQGGQFAIADGVAAELGVKLADVSLPPALRRVYFDKYLEARRLVGTRKPEDVQSAIDLYKDILTVEPNFADGHARLAHATSVLLTLDQPPVQEFKRMLADAENAANRAIAIDTQNDFALTVRGIVQLMAENYSASEQSFVQALMINPNSSEAYNWYGDLLAIAGRVDEQVAAEARAAALDPLLMPNLYNAAQAYLAAGDLESAELYIEKALALDPEYAIAKGIKLEIARAAGERDAITALREDFRRRIETPQHSPFDHNSYYVTLAYIFLAELAGDEVMMRQIADDFAQWYEPGGEATSFIAMVYAQSGDFEKAGVWLNALSEHAYFTRYPIYFPTTPDILHKNPTYAAFWRRPEQRNLMAARGLSRVTDD